MSKSAKSILWIVIIIIVIVVIIAVGKGKNSGQMTSSEPIKIGFIAALSGDAATYGESTKGGADLAVKEINDAGGVNGQKIELIAEDGKCNGKDAATAAQKLISIDQVKYIVGMPCSGEVLGVAPETEKNKVIVFAQGSSPDITAAGEYIFRTFPSDLVSSKAVADHATAKGLKTAALVTENTDYAIAMDKAFSDAFAADGGKVLDSEKYNTGNTDFKSQLAKIKALKPDMIFLNAQTGGNGARIAKQARELGLTSQFYTAFFSGDEFVKSGDAVNGTYVVDVPILNSADPKVAAFLKLYTDTNGKDPAYPFFAGGAYDQIHMLVDAIKSVGADTDKVKDYLYALPSYTGISGTLHFDAGGDVIGVSESMKHIVGNQIQAAN